MLINGGWRRPWSVALSLHRRQMHRGDYRRGLLRPESKNEGGKKSAANMSFTRGGDIGLICYGSILFSSQDITVLCLRKIVMRRKRIPLCMQKGCKHMKYGKRLGGHETIVSQIHSIKTKEQEFHLNFLITNSFSYNLYC